MVKRVGEVAYELSLPASMSGIHPVFHVSLLRKHQDGGRQSSPPPAVLLDGEEECNLSKCWLMDKDHVARSINISLSSLCHGKAWGLSTVSGFLSVS